MGVSFLQTIENIEAACKLEKISQDHYTGYRNDAVYKECSFPIQKSKKSNKKLNKRDATNEKIQKNKPTTNFDKFSWTKIYRSPIPVRSQRNSVIELNELKSAIKQNQEVELFDTNIKLNQNTTQTYLSRPLEERSSIRLQHSICSKLGPKLLCPCCCGGDDKMESCDMPYNRQTTSDSYESIDLTNNSNTFIPINLDASLVSILCFRKLSRQKNKSMYIKMALAVIRNSYKNIICMFNLKTASARVPSSNRL